MTQAPKSRIIGAYRKKYKALPLILEEKLLTTQAYIPDRVVAVAVVVAVLKQPALLLRKLFSERPYE